MKNFFLILLFFILSTFSLSILLEGNVAPSLAENTFYSAVVQSIPLTPEQKAIYTDIVKTLLKQVEVLQAELARLLASSSSTPIPSVSLSGNSAALKPCSFTRVLSVGVRGDDVRCLQESLKVQGHFNEKPTGYFGSITREAVASWQRKENIPIKTDAYGIFGTRSQAYFAEQVTKSLHAVPSVSAAGAPVVLSHSPDGLISFANSTILSVTTDIPSQCRYGTSPDPYTLLTKNFDGAHTTTHQAVVDGLSPNTAYNFYVRCASDSGAESSVRVISFIIVENKTAPASYIPPSNTNFVSSGPSNNSPTTCSALYNGTRYICSITRVTQGGVYQKNVNVYDRVVVPRENGREVTMTNHRHSYPSRSQFGQFMIFINTVGNSVLLVHAKDSNPTAQQDWWLSNNHTIAPCMNRAWCMRVTFRGAAPDVDEVVFSGTTDWHVAAAYYKNWASKQSWYRGHGKITDGQLGHVILGSTNSYNYYNANLSPLISFFSPKRVGVFMTQYRNDRFDVNYPNYTCSKGANCPVWLQSLKDSGNGFGLPYINGTLWDATHAKYNAREMCLDSKGNPVVYSASLPNLRYVDPTLSTWPQTLYDAFDALNATDGTNSEGVYIDVSAAGEPRPCYYNFVANYNVWIAGVKAVLQKFDNQIIMAEGLGEVYLPYVDIAYITGNSTGTTGSIGMFGFIYGDARGINIVGMTTDMEPSEQKLIDYQDRARNVFNHDAMLFSSGITNDIALNLGERAKHLYKLWGQ